MSLLQNMSNVRVSSVLNRDSKQYGKKFLFDGNDDTCWNSDQGKIQWIQIKLEENSILMSQLKLSVQFQGGFSCRQCNVDLMLDGNIISSAQCYPEDINSLQTFDLNFITTTDIKKYFNEVKFNFKETTDFFGRITIYCLDLLQCE